MQSTVQYSISYKMGDRLELLMKSTTGKELFEAISISPKVQGPPCEKRGQPFCSNKLDLQALVK